MDSIFCLSERGNENKKKSQLESEQFTARNKKKITANINDIQKQKKCVSTSNNISIIYVRPSCRSG